MDQSFKRLTQVSVLQNRIIWHLLIIIDSVFEKAQFGYAPHFWKGELHVTSEPSDYNAREKCVSIWITSSEPDTNRLPFRFIHNSDTPMTMKQHRYRPADSNPTVSDRRPNIRIELSIHRWCIRTVGLISCNALFGMNGVHYFVWIAWFDSKRLLLIYRNQWWFELLHCDISIAYRFLRSVQVHLQMYTAQRFKK